VIIHPSSFVTVNHRVLTLTSGPKEKKNIDYFQSIGNSDKRLIAAIVRIWRLLIRAPGCINTRRSFC
jgi:hypothetical protein